MAFTNDLEFSAKTDNQPKTTNPTATKPAAVAESSKPEAKSSEISQDKQNPKDEVKTETKVVTNQDVSDKKNDPLLDLMIATESPTCNQETLLQLATSARLESEASLKSQIDAKNQHQLLASTSKSADKKRQSSSSQSASLNESEAEAQDPKSQKTHVQTSKKTNEDNEKRTTKKRRTKTKKNKYAILWFFRTKFVKVFSFSFLCKHFLGF